MTTRRAPVAIRRHSLTAKTALVPGLAALSLALALPAADAHAARPDPVNATYLDGQLPVPLQNRSTYIYQPDAKSSNGCDDGSCRAARAVCGDGATASQSDVCPADKITGFIDAETRALVSEGRGMTEFMRYEVAGTPLHFKVGPLEYAAVVIANAPGGSGIFYSVALVAGVGDGRAGSSLLGLGDRVRAVQLRYDEKAKLLAVTYQDPYADGAPNFDKPKRVNRSYRVQGRELIEVANKKR